MHERKIAPVSDNKEKFFTYTELTGKYNIAMENDFYFEAMFIVYAMMEDRLRSYLYYLGCLRSKESYKFDNSNVESIIETLAQKHLPKKERDSLDIKNISGKRNVISATLNWALAGYEGSDCEYLAAVKAVYEDKLNVAECLDMLKKSAEWCEYRNELIHAMMNKNIESLYSELSDKAVEGMTIARYFDNGMVKKLKESQKAETREVNFREIAARAERYPILGHPMVNEVEHTKDMYILMLLSVAALDDEKYEESFMTIYRIAFGMNFSGNIESLFLSAKSMKFETLDECTRLFLNSKLRLVLLLECMMIAAGFENGKRRAME